MRSLQKLQDDLEGDEAFWGGILEAGIHKVSDYSDLFFEVPAHAFAISEWLFYEAM